MVSGLAVVWSVVAATVGLDEFGAKEGLFGVDDQLYDIPSELLELARRDGATLPIVIGRACDPAVLYAAEELRDYAHWNDDADHGAPVCERRLTEGEIGEDYGWLEVGTVDPKDTYYVFVQPLRTDVRGNVAEVRIESVELSDAAKRCKSLRQLQNLSPMSVVRVTHAHSAARGVLVSHEHYGVLKLPPLL